MTKFEMISDLLSNNRYDDLKENCIYWLDGDKFATVNVNTRSRYASRIRKLAKGYPEEVKIFSDEKNGYMVAAVPVKAVKLNIIHVDLTDERKDLLRRAWEAKREGRDSMELFDD